MAKKLATLVVSFEVPTALTVDVVRENLRCEVDGPGLGVLLPIRQVQVRQADRPTSKPPKPRAAGIPTRRGRYG